MAKVWICTDKKTGAIVDVLKVSEHPKLTSSDRKTFHCVEAEWTDEQYNKFKTPLPDFSINTDEDLIKALGKRGYDESKIIKKALGIKEDK